MIALLVIVLFVLLVGLALNGALSKPPPRKPPQIEKRKRDHLKLVKDETDK